MRAAGQSGFERKERLFGNVRGSGLSFLAVELEIAITMAQIALQSPPGSAKRRRNSVNAHKALDTILRIEKKLPLSSEEAKQFQPNMEKLRELLTSLGEQ